MMNLSASLAGFLVISCKKLEQSEKFLRFGNCFAAGIFLLVGIMNLLDESQEKFEEFLVKKCLLAVFLLLEVMI